ncbi:MAG: murein biosynthesis integral membrane protein MurJ [Candidatus Omnitrophica bacterium]|nr:murein biosynthesis integral membrane protein MurJ [Candidatus Omnitrophota bacterium]
MTRFKLLASAGKVGGLTLISRILGMARDIASAGLFGAGRVWDAFVLAFSLPNLLRRLFFEGAVSSAFIPIYVEILQKEGRDAALEFTSHVAKSIFLVFLIFAFGFYGFLLSTGLFHLLPGKWKLAFDFMAILIPYSFLLLAAGLFGAVLNAQRHFVAPALSTIILNASWLGAVLWLLPKLSLPSVTRVQMLCWIIVLAGFLQLLIQWIALGEQRKFLVRIWQAHSSHRQRFMRAIGPTIAGFSVLYINLLADFLFGYLFEEGMSSILWYASRLMQFPLGLFAVSLSTVLVPEYSHQASENQREEMAGTLSFSIRSVMWIILPSAVGLIALAHPIVQTLFERGEFTASDTLKTGASLIGYAAGLPFYALIPTIAAAFYGMQHTSIPMKAGFFAILIHLILCPLLWRIGGVGGLAFSTSISGAANFFILYFLFQKKSRELDSGRILIFCFKVLGVSLMMGVGVAWVYSHIPLGGISSGFAGTILRLFLAIAAGICFLIAGCFMTGMHEMKRAFEWIFFKK